MNYCSKSDVFYSVILFVSIYFLTILVTSDDVMVSQGYKLQTLSSSKIGGSL